MDKRGRGERAEDREFKNELNTWICIFEVVRAFRYLEIGVGEPCPLLYQVTLHIATIYVNFNFIQTKYHIDEYFLIFKFHYVMRDVVICTYKHRGGELDHK